MHSVHLGERFKEETLRIVLIAHADGPPLGCPWSAIQVATAADPRRANVVCFADAADRRGRLVA